MRLEKAVIAELAIDEYARKTGRGEYFRTNAKCGSVEYAFTKTIPQWIREDLLETMRSIETALGCAEPIFYPGDMGSVTRDKDLWDK